MSEELVWALSVLRVESLPWGRSASPPRCGSRINGLSLLPPHRTFFLTVHLGDSPDALPDEKGARTWAKTLGFVMSSSHTALLFLPSSSLLSSLPPSVPSFLPSFPPFPLFLSLPFHHFSSLSFLGLNFEPHHCNAQVLLLPPCVSQTQELSPRRPHTGKAHDLGVACRELRGR